MPLTFSSAIRLTIVPFGARIDPRTGRTEHRQPGHHDESDSDNDVHEGPRPA
jgi:hypothetical protein